MEEILNLALQQEATNAKILDSSLLAHPAFTAVIDAIKTVDDVPAVVQKLRVLRPTWFESYASMDDQKFAEQEGVLGRMASRAVEHPMKAELAELFKGVDSGKLNGEDFETFENAWRAYMSTDYSRVDVPKLKALIVRQKAA